MTQIAFAQEDAHQALDEFLAAPSEGSRWIGSKNRRQGDDYGEPVAYIVSADSWHRVQNGYHHWTEAQEVADEEQSASYRPWIHSPRATTDRLLPTEPLHDTLAWAIFKKKYAELEENDQRRVKATAIACLLEVQLDPDGQGAVPILSVGHDPENPGESLRWQIGIRTKIRGLYLRVTGNGFLGEEWGILTGSGYRITSGYYDQDSANSAAEALGRVLPNTDWMRLGPNAFTPAAKTAIRGVLKRYHVWGLNDKADEPDVCEDRMPAEAAQ
jgi:hypothetical protein